MGSRSTVEGGEARGSLAWLWTAYDETTLFLIAVTCILLVVVPTGLREDLARAMASREDSAGFFLVVGSAAASLLAIYHVFTTRRKYLVEKVALAAFATIASGAAAILSGMEILRSGAYANAVFPVLNILGGVLLFYQLGIAQEDTVADDNATTAGLVVGLAVLIALFAYCQAVRHLSWPLTLSICVGYSTFAHRVFARLQYLWWMR